MNNWKQGGTIRGGYDPNQHSRFVKTIESVNQKMSNKQFFLQNNTLPNPQTNNYEYYQKLAQEQELQKQIYQQRQIYQQTIEGGTSNRERKKIFNNEARVQNSRFTLAKDIEQITSKAEPLIRKVDSEFCSHQKQVSLQYSEEEQKKLLQSQPKTSLVVRNSTVAGEYQKDVSVINFKPIFENKPSSPREENNSLDYSTSSLISEQTEQDKKQTNSQLQHKCQEKYSLIRFEDDISQIVLQKKSNKVERKFEIPSQQNEQVQINQFAQADKQELGQRNQIFCQDVPKISNFVTVNTSKSGEYTMNNQKSSTQPNFQNEVEVLKEMNYAREQRVHRFEIPFFSHLTSLEQSECLSDLRTQDQNLRNLIVAQFPFIRNVRGDGNCLFSSLVFPYLECIYINNDFDSVLNNLIIHDIYWREKILIDKLIAQTQIMTIFRQLKQLSERSSLMIYSEVILYYMNNVNGFYDLMVIFIRSLILESYNQYSQSDAYKIFYDEQKLEEDKERIRTFEEEGEYNLIPFFIERTQINVKIIQFDQENPLKSMQFLEPKINKNTQQKKKDTFITLKYNQGHYDILYSRMMKQIQKSEVSDINEYFINFSGLY